MDEVVNRSPTWMLQQAVRRYLLVLTAALTASTAMAERDDILSSKDCRHALASLEVQEAASSAAVQASSPSGSQQSPAPDLRLLSLRRLAARACLGGHTELPSAEQRYSTPPIAVPPIVAVPPVAAVPPPPPVLPSSRPLVQPSRPVEPLTTITACDAVGCWASDGTRLHRVGPNLQGPRGLCSVQGGVLHCP
jgi:hypothetical protein